MNAQRRLFEGPPPQWTAVGSLRIGRYTCLFSLSLVAKGNRASIGRRNRELTMRFESVQGKAGDESDSALCCYANFKCFYSPKIIFFGLYCGHPLKVCMQKFYAYIRFLPC